MLSVIIPNYKDKDLQRTIDDIKSKAKGEIEIIVIDDEKEMIGMRGCINKGVAQSKGEWIMKCDSHCMFGEGFDEKILSNIEDNWVVIPRRFKLDTDKWEVMDEPPIDYEKLFIAPEKIGGVYWTNRAIARKDILIDETMVFQGSCWIMSRKHWDWLGGLQEEGYGTFTQEPIEIALKTWLGGGKVMVNKTTWYAHRHRKFGRHVHITSQEVRDGNAYSKDFWLNNRWEKRIHDIDWLFKRFK